MTWGVREGEGERAVSPVVGVVLMVAITVVLAGAAGAMLLGFGPLEPAPTVSYSFSSSGDELTITHTHGRAIEAGTLTVHGVADEDTLAGGSRVGTSVTVEPVDETIRIVWTGIESGSSYVLGEYGV
ncbi:type IV pilin N-terminal domain-containing protein [Natronorarus salvus]|uniref:type IV pilin N-terminal domain-containing protein n=1 Tax=Natronorarus salvus TaxID=3117733 RepID=UPI002F26611A